MSSSELLTPAAAPSEERGILKFKWEKVIEEHKAAVGKGWWSVCAGEDRGENEEEEAVFFRQKGGGKRESRRNDCLSILYEFHFFSLLVQNARWFYGKECCSLAVTIGARMNLDPIELPSMRREYKLGVLSSINKSCISLVMEFLEEVAGNSFFLHS
jgi:hypothetical protein